VALDTRRGLEDLRGALGEQAALEAQRAEGERARALAALGGGLTRELGSIFALLLGKSQLLMARAQDESLREGLGALEEAAWRGTDVLQRLLGLAEVDHAVGVSCDLGAIAQEALAFARPRIGPGAPPGGRRIEMTADLPSTPPVQGSAVAFREAIVNLVLNAMEAMPDGGTVAVQVRETGGGVELVVADGGRGIAPDVKPRIFDPFFTTRPGHLGLGLTVAQAVVLRAGGRLDVQTGPGGTTVSLWLPAERAREAAAEVEAHHPGEAALATAPEPAPPRVGSVLIVEEEEGVQASVREALDAAGHRVETAVDATTALERLAVGGIDVVVTDLALRDRSGLQLAAAVKERSPGSAVVLLTGWGRRLHEERVRGAGVDVMVVKPVQPERVRAAVAEALRLHPPA
jgi:CheY-like chemotaxis protein